VLPHNRNAYPSLFGPKTAWLRLRLFLLYAHEQKVIAADITQNVSCRWVGVPGGLAGYQGVLRKLYSIPSRLLQYRLPLFAPHWEAHLQQLMDEGYNPRTIQKIVDDNYLFHEFLLRRKIRSFTQVTFALAEKFFHERRAHFRKIHKRPLNQDYAQVFRASILKFLAFASGKPYRPRIKGPPPSNHPVLSDKLLADYLEFCRNHKGLNDRTLRGCRYQLLRLRAFLHQRGKQRIQDVTAADLDAFYLYRAADAGGTTPQSVPQTLRPFFRYLVLKDLITSNPADGLFSPCRFSMDHRPKYIPWPNVQKLLNSIDRARPVGKRDYAILALLAHHGLRAREVATLKITDIDWDTPSLWLFHRKNGANARIPLSEVAKEALKNYLAVRPASPPWTEVFLTTQAPIVPLGGRLGAVAQRHLFRFFGRSIPRHGAYVLRHSFAKALLDRGARLPDIATLLGHRKLESTLTYTQVDTEGLREVADNYATLLIPLPEKDKLL
jgi:integrase/recombinase XerD